MLLILSSQSALLRNPFSGSKQDLAPRANLFKLSFGRMICRIDDCQWQHFPPWQVFFSQFHIKDFSVFPLLFSWRGFNLNEDVSGGGWRTSVFLLVLFSADAVSRSPTWGYLWLPKLLHVLCADLFSSGAPHYYWQASQQLWKHTAYVEQMLWLHSQTEFSRRQIHQRDHIRTISCSIFFCPSWTPVGAALQD